jgi:hypothetical protein
MKNGSALSHWINQKRRKNFVILVVLICIVALRSLQAKNHLKNIIIVFGTLLIVYVALSLILHISERSRDKKGNINQNDSPSFYGRLTKSTLQILGVNLPEMTSSASRTVNKFGIPGELRFEKNRLSFRPGNAIRGLDFTEPINFDYDYFENFSLIRNWNKLGIDCWLGVSNKNSQVIEFIVRDKKIRKLLSERILQNETKQV